MQIDWGRLARLPKWIYVLGFLGIALLLSGSLFAKDSGKPSEPKSGSKIVNTDRMSMSEYEHVYETKLAEVLSQIHGVSDVTVMVNLDSTEELVFAENDSDQNSTTTENDKQGGTRTITQVNKNKDIVMTKGSSDQPVVVKTVKPHVRGVLVVAKGAEQPRIQAIIMESVQRVLEVPPHRIGIQAKN